MLGVDAGMTTNAQAASAVLRVDGSIATIVLSQPPANALGDTMRAEIFAHIEAAEADPSVTAIVLAARGRAFSKGISDADLDRPQSFPDINVLCDRVETCAKPVVAALSGAVVSEGAALALAAHCRVMDDSARIAVPDVTFALVPSGGLTQRLPRLVGVEAGLAILLSGRVIGPQAALKMGLVDKIEMNRVRVAAMKLASEKAQTGDAPRQTRAIDTIFDHGAAGRAAIAAARAQTSGRTFAGKRIIDCVEAAMLLPFEGGVWREETERADTLAAPQSAALRHAHMSERRAVRPRGFVTDDARDVKALGLSGASTLALGLCLIALDHGVSVRFLAPTAEVAKAMLATVNKAYEAAEAKGQMTADQKHDRLEAFFVSADPACFDDCDAVIEATTGSLDARVAALVAVEAALAPDMPLATVSDRALAQMAGRLTHPQRFCAAHVFAPAQVIRLVELGRAPLSASASLATFHALFTRLGKRVVTVEAEDGFVANRLEAAGLQAVDICLLLGARPAQIDAALRRFGFSIGPCAMMDRIGLRHFGGTVAQALDAAGLAERSGRGFFDADGSDAQAVEVLEMLREAGDIEAATVTEAEIVKRVVLAQANAGAQALERGVVARPLEIDVIMMLGKGFPRHQGGPMQWAGQMTALQAETALKQYAQFAPQIWTPASLWHDLVKTGETFETLNKSG
ncbi:3-hydroxyacyl-CoA dehydrogenase [Celeribacter marinus]|nr:3-hydroxyacyl-CoA dehydrogenase [Celeribacter marinus]